MAAAQQVKKKSAEMQGAIDDTMEEIQNSFDRIIEYAEKPPAFDLDNVRNSISDALSNMVEYYGIECKFTPNVPFMASNKVLKNLGHSKPPKLPPTPHRPTGFAAMFGAPPVNGKNGSAVPNRNHVAPRVLFHPEGQREITNYMRGTKRARMNGGRRKTRRSSTRKCSG